MTFNEFISTRNRLIFVPIKEATNDSTVEGTIKHIKKDRVPKERKLEGVHKVLNVNCVIASKVYKFRNFINKIFFVVPGKTDFLGDRFC